MSKRTERHAVQVRRMQAARRVAVNRLIERHGEEFRRLYVEEATKIGVAPAASTGLVTKKRRGKPLLDEVRASGILDGVSVPASPDRYALPDQPIVAVQRMTRDEQLEAAAAGVPHRQARSENIIIPPPPWE